MAKNLFRILRSGRYTHSNVKKLFDRRFHLSWLCLPAGILFVIAVWEIIASSTGEKFLPEFFSCFMSMILLFGDANAMVSLGYSLLRLLISLIISFLLGVFFGVLAGYFDILARTLFPLIAMLRAIPTIAVIFLLAVYVPHFSLYVVSLVLFPVIYQASLEGSSSVYHQYERDFMLRGRYRLDNIAKVVLPLSTDYILLGLIQGVGLGIKVEIMAETFSYKADYYGLGKKIYQCYASVEYREMMAYVLLALLLSIILDSILLVLRDRLEKKLDISKQKRLSFFFSF